MILWWLRAGTPYMCTAVATCAGFVGKQNMPLALYSIFSQSGDAQQHAEATCLPFETS